jgi:hypothetical protein
MGFKTQAELEALAQKWGATVEDIVELEEFCEQVQEAVDAATEAVQNQKDSEVLADD